MKRSDLIWKLTDSVFNEDINLIKNITDFQNADNWSSAHRHLRLLISNIISKAEQMGMQPPENKEKSYRLEENGEMTYAVNEWDEE